MNKSSCEAAGLSNKPRLNSCHLYIVTRNVKIVKIRTVFIEISMLSWNLPNGPKHRGPLLKKHGFLRRELAICRWFLSSSRRNKRWYASIYKEMELEMDFLRSRILLQKLPATTIDSTSKHVYLQGWSLKFKWWLGKM